MKIMSLSTEELNELNLALKGNQFNTQYYNRIQSIKLSNKKYSITEISKILDVHYNSVGEWLRKYEAGGIDELFDKPKSGRPPILTNADIKKVEKFVEAEPRQLKSVLVKIEEKLGKMISIDTLKRAIKSKDYTYRRVRKSLKSKRDEADFESKKKS